MVDFSGYNRYEILDGLRGVATLCVLVRRYTLLPLPQAWLGNVGWARTNFIYGLPRVF